jgi:hypothetical protein
MRRREFFIAFVGGAALARTTTGRVLGGKQPTSNIAWSSSGAVKMAGNTKRCQR